MAASLPIVIQNTDMELPILLTNHSNEKFSVDSHCRQSTRQAISFKQQRDSFEHYYHAFIVLHCGLIHWIVLGKIFFGKIDIIFARNRTIGQLALLQTNILLKHYFPSESMRNFHTILIR